MDKLSLAIERLEHQGYDIRQLDMGDLGYYSLVFNLDSCHAVLGTVRGIVDFSI